MVVVESEIKAFGRMVKRAKGNPRTAKCEKLSPNTVDPTQAHSEFGVRRTEESSKGNPRTAKCEKLSPSIESRSDDADQAEDEILRWRFEVEVEQSVEGIEPFGSRQSMIQRLRWTRRKRMVKWTAKIYSEGALGKRRHKFIIGWWRSSLAKIQRRRMAREKESMVIDPTVEINPRAHPTAENNSGEGVNGYSANGIDRTALRSNGGEKFRKRECKRKFPNANYDRLEFGVRSSGVIDSKGTRSTNCELQLSGRKGTQNAIANGKAKG